MKANPPLRRTRGLTLVEIMVVALLASFFVVFLFLIMRNFSKGVVNVQRAVPLQRDLQFAKSIIEKDLLSAPRSSIGNVVPQSGFESNPTQFSDQVPPPQGAWACTPTLFRMDGGIRYATGFINSRPNFVRNGNASLIIDSRGSVGLYTAHSSTFSLVGGRKYIFGAWVFTIAPNSIQTDIELVGDLNTDAFGSTPVGWPETNRVYAFTTWTNWEPTPAAEIGRWVFLCRPFTAAANYNYRVRVGNASTNNTRLNTSVDDFIVTLSSWTMNNVSNDTFEFNNYMVDGPLKNQWVRLRYRWAPKGASGQLIRERIDPLTGAVLQNLDPLDNIRHVFIAWDFGQAAPGEIPTAPPAPGGPGPLATTGVAWNAFFAKGMTFPLIVTLEAGDIGATAPRFLSLRFSVFPEMP